MTTIDDAAREAADPATPPARLAELLTARPDLGAMIARHPQAYPEMLAWIGRHGDTAAQAAVLERLAPPTQSATAAAFVPAAPVVPPPAAPVGATPALPGAPIVPAVVLAASAPARRKLKRPAIVGIVAGVAALALAGGAFAVVKTLTGGAPSPEAAAQRLVDGVLGGNLLSLATAFAPSEAAYVTPLIDAASKIPVDGKDNGAADAVARLHDALKITTKDVEFTSEKIAEGVAIVELASGSVHIDGDAQKVADASVDLTYASNPYLAYGRTSADLEQAKADAKRSMAESLKFPIDWKAKDQIAQATQAGRDNPFRIVTVDEGGWYVSPLMSTAELGFIAGRPGPQSALQRGSTIVPAVHFDTPEAALDGTAQAVAQAYETGRWQPLAATLPLPERRVLSIYGPALPATMEQQALQQQGTAKITVQAHHESENGDTVVIPDKLSVAVTGSGRPLFDATMTDECMASRVTGYTSGYDSSNGSNGSSSFCPKSIPALSKLGLTRFQLVAVQENGGWLIDPLASVTHEGVIALRGYAHYAKDGKLDELFGTSGGE
ncbi:hypothetical protein [Microbacterium sp. 22242]|uniref:variant leucine-rich repeat-containing protein n=1 Tax=Microbacterium sp. 22242 TaxID=3453896 RepID=UPI003F857476